jgi:hypothetical protein
LLTPSRISNVGTNLGDEIDITKAKDTGVLENTSVQKPPYTIDFISKYNIMYKPKVAVDEYQIEAIVGNILRKMQEIDRKAALISGNDLDAPHIHNANDIPTNDEALHKFIKDLKTSPTGEHGKLSN